MDNIILKVLRTKKISQGSLSRKSGVDRVQLWKIVNGKVPYVRLTTAIKIAKALGVTVEDLWKP